jgi:predicted dehydrogenase
MEQKIRIAIAGLGFGAEFIPIYQRYQQTELIAICQRTKSKMDEIGDAFGIEKRYTSYKEMIQDPDIDAVHINTPIPDHGWQS